jgi:hypothetical protein
MMELSVLWSGVLTFALGLFGWIIRAYVEEVKRLNILVNRTREEIAKEYVTKSEVHADINRVIARLESLDGKLDRLIENHKGS